MDKVRLTLLVVFLCVPQMAPAADERDFEKFRQEMLKRDCKFSSTKEGMDLQKTLKWNDAKFSEVMLWLAIKGEFVCPAGCRLIHPQCPKPPVKKPSRVLR